MYFREVFVGEVVSEEELGVEIGKVFDDNFKDFESEFWVGFAETYKTVHVGLMHAQRAKFVRVVLF
jgi:hypothetical protein